MQPSPNLSHGPNPYQVVIQQLIHLEEADPGVPIAMHIMSGGGKVYAGLAILDVMRALTSPVHTTCLGHCESMAAVLLACGEPGHRYALPNARVMIHQPVRGASPSKSSAKEALIQAQAIDASRLRLCQLLAESTGRPLHELEVRVRVRVRTRARVRARARARARVRVRARVSSWQRAQGERWQSLRQPWTPTPSPIPHPTTLTLRSYPAASPYDPKNPRP